MNGSSLTDILCKPSSTQRYHHNLKKGSVHMPRTTAAMVNSTKAFFLKNVFTSSLVMSSTFFLAFRERSWMSSRIRCTRLRERGFSPLLLVMATAPSYLYFLDKSAVWPDRANPKLSRNVLKCSQGRKGCHLFYTLTASIWLHVSANLKWFKHNTLFHMNLEKKKNNGFWLAGVHLISLSVAEKNFDFIWSYMQLKNESFQMKNKDLNCHYRTQASAFFWTCKVICSVWT